MGGFDYKNMQYGFIAEQLTDYQLGMFKDGIENYLAGNYGTAEFAFSRINKRFQKDITEYLKWIDETTEGMDDDGW